MSKRLTTKEFIQKAVQVHGQTYDYSEVVYKDRNTPIRIICKIHGAFEQRPFVHVGKNQNHGCPICGREKQRETNMIKYGVSVSSQADSVKEKAKQTNQVRYGGNSPQSDKVVREKSKDTWMKKYGTDNPMGSPECREKIRLSNLDRYGVEWAAQNSEIRERQKETCRIRYGGISPLCDDAIRAMGRNTMLQKYGVSHPMFSDEIKQQLRKTVLVRYGVDHPMHEDSIVTKMVESKRVNGTFNTSSPEETAYAMLCQVFGESDIIRQYQSELYPFSCDFYVQSCDLYIEMNLSWTHGSGFFDPDEPEDIRKLEHWKECAKHSIYYANAIETWTVRDVTKLHTALKNDLNYLTFWKQDLSDFMEWLDRQGVLL